MARLCPHRIGEKVDFATTDDPNALWPTTTWAQDTSGTFPMASSSEHALGSSGGSETHTLTVDEIPSHQHRTGIQGNRAGNLNSGSSSAYVFYDQTSGVLTTATGGGVVFLTAQPLHRRQPLGARGLKRLGEVA